MEPPPVYTNSRSPEPVVRSIQSRDRALMTCRSGKSSERESVWTEGVLERSFDDYHRGGGRGVAGFDEFLLR